MLCDIDKNLFGAAVVYSLGLVSDTASPKEFYMLLLMT